MNSALRHDYRAARRRQVGEFVLGWFLGALTFCVVFALCLSWAPSGWAVQ